MMLHAHEIKFKNMKIEATTKVPDDFVKLMKKHD